MDNQYNDYSGNVSDGVFSTESNAGYDAGISGQSSPINPQPVDGAATPAQQYADSTPTPAQQFADSTTTPTPAQQYTDSTPVQQTYDDSTPTPVQQYADSAPAQQYADSAPVLQYADSTPTPVQQTYDAATAQVSGAVSGQPATGQAQTREEWERQQREIQDREWQSRQAQYNQQLAEQRTLPPYQWNEQTHRYEPQPAQYAGQPQMYGGQSPTMYGSEPTHQYNNPSQPFDAQFANQHQQDYYAQNPAGAVAPNQENAYYNAYGQPVAPQGQQPQSPSQQKAAKKAARRARRNNRLKYIAAALVGALIMAAVFGIGYQFANSGVLSRPNGAQNILAAGDTNNVQSESQPAQASISDSQPNQQGGLFGNQTGRSPILPPSSSQNKNDKNSDANSQQQQPPQLPQQQQQQQQQQQLPQLPQQQQPQLPQQQQQDQQQEQTREQRRQPQSQNPAATGVNTAGGGATLKLNPPGDTELSVPEIYQKVYPSIVGVRITFPSQGYRFGGIMMPGREESGEGSGIIIHEDGYIMTNQHVVDYVIDSSTRSQISGTKIEVFLPDDQSTAYPAVIVGYDQSTDLCVLKIEKSGLKAAELGDADKLNIGEFVVAIGNPGGMEYMSSITFGIISGMNRSIHTEGYRNIQLIQTDAAINPGNSGGALINIYGQVIGINSIKIAASDFEGLGFAIPINAAATICNDLMNYTYVTGRPYIGITTFNDYTEQMANQYNMPVGVYVYEVDENGPSYQIIHNNDIIVKLNSEEVKDFDSLEALKNKYKPGDKITLQIYRDWSTNDYSNGTYIDIEIVLGEKRN